MELRLVLPTYGKYNNCFIIRGISSYNIIAYSL